MDISKLHQLAADAEIGFQHQDGFMDAEQCWIDGWMASPEHLKDIWIDALLEMLPTQENLFLGQIGRQHIQHQKLVKEIGTTLGIDMALATSCATNNSHTGGDILDCVLRYVTQQVKENSEQWWSDCCGYEFDMKEGGREDYEYEKRRDEMAEH